eukprot:1303820-Rhodomonas_salina.1
MEIASFAEAGAASPSAMTEALVDSYLDGAGSDAREAEFMVSILGDNDYARQLAVDYAKAIHERYGLNGRYMRAFWINPVRHPPHMLRGRGDRAVLCGGRVCVMVMVMVMVIVCACGVCGVCGAGVRVDAYADGREVAVPGVPEDLPLRAHLARRELGRGASPDAAADCRGRREPSGGGGRRGFD